MNRRPAPHKQPSPMHRHSAFTIMELLVAIVIAGVFLSIIGVIFNSTNEVTRTGIAGSKLLSTSRAVRTMLERDAGGGEDSSGNTLPIRMIGPHDDASTPPPAAGNSKGVESTGGVLAIVQHVVGDWNNDGVLNADANGDGIIDVDEQRAVNDSTYQFEGVRFPIAGGKHEYRLVRSDQLMFLKKRDPLDYPLTPSGTNAFTPMDDSSYPANVQKVWFGHVLVTDDDGTDTVDPTNANSADTWTDGYLGRPGFLEDGTTWAFGRQAMFLRDVTLSSPIRANGPFWYSDVLNYVGTLDSIPAVAYMGLTDYADTAFDGDPDPTGSPSTPPFVLVGDSDTTPTNNIPVVLNPTLTNDEYKQTVLTGLCYTPKRLRANPEPTEGVTTNGDAYQSWQIAQMHPIMAMGISDFTVDFAGDFYDVETELPSYVGLVDDPNGFDYDASSKFITYNGNITGGPDGEIDRHFGYPAGTDSNGVAYEAIPPGIKWYTSAPFSNNPYSVDINGNANYDATKPLTFAAPVNDFPPYVNVNIDPGYNDAAANMTTGFVWRHDDEAGSTFAETPAPDGSAFEVPGLENNRQTSLWPYMLRIRYRMHDPKGLIRTGDNVQGRWFEQIIRVSRP